MGIKRETIIKIYCNSCDQLEVFNSERDMVASPWRKFEIFGICSRGPYREGHLCVRCFELIIAIIGPDIVGPDPLEAKQLSDDWT